MLDRISAAAFALCALGFVIAALRTLAHHIAMQSMGAF